MTDFYGNLSPTDQRLEGIAGLLINAERQRQRSAGWVIFVLCLIFVGWDNVLGVISHILDLFLLAIGAVHWLFL